MYTVFAVLVVGALQCTRTEGLGSRPFSTGVTVSSTCFGQQRRSGVGCDCRLRSLPCSESSGTICLPSTTGQSTTGLKCQFGPLTVQSQFIFRVGREVCTGDSLFNLACGGVPSLTCSITVLNATSAAGTYTGTPAFLNVVNPSSGCCFVTAASAAPAQDIYVCYTVKATDSAGATATGPVCVLIQKPDPNAVCPATTTTATSVSATVSGIDFIPGCTLLDTVVKTITASGGTGPYTYSLTLNTITGLTTVEVTQYRAAFPTGPLALDPKTGILTTAGDGINKSVVLCFTATVTDSKQATSTTNFCVTSEATPPPIVTSPPGAVNNCDATTG